MEPGAVAFDTLSSASQYRLLRVRGERATARCVASHVSATAEGALCVAPGAYDNTLVRLLNYTNFSDAAKLAVAT